MADIGITSDQIIEAKCSPYLETIESEEEKQAFLQRMKDAAKTFIQNFINKINAILDSITETCNKIISSASTWAAQIVAIATPDPTAPKAGAASLVSLKNSVEMAKSNLSIANAQMAEVNEFVSLAGVGVPPIVETTTSLLSSADYALQAIPI
jgi:hypothetical protein